MAIAGDTVMGDGSGAKHEESVIDFGSIAAGQVVRAVKINDVYYMPRRDIIMAIAKCDIKAASDIWTRRLTELEKEEASYGCAKHQFDGPGQSETEVLTFDGALSLALCIPGPVAKKIRIQARRLLKKWLHDHTADPLMREITAEPQGTLGTRSMEDLEMDRQERRVALRERRSRSTLRLTLRLPPWCDLINTVVLGCASVGTL